MLRFILPLLALVASPVMAEPIKVEGGLIEGKDLDGGVRGWFGVPFAKPPLRELRWQPPRPVEGWSGVLPADRFAPMCLQGLRSRTMNHYFGNEATSEDCLYLNVWAPQGAAGRKLPVVVWIYGGGFNVGSASMANYQGANLAKDGVVYVSLAYRVGPMGFLAHPELTREGGGHSGNYGLMDQVAGLEWVQRNIAAFGGDPGNVTVMGQSAGSMSVSLLQMNPRAKGLFHKLVGMSGSAHGEMMSPVPLAKGEQQGAALQQALGANGIEAMRDLPGDRVLAVAATVPRSAIVIDGANITGTADEVFAARRQNDVPVMVGFTRDERFANLGPASTVAEYQAAVRKAFPQTGEQVLKAYPVKDDAGVNRALVDIMRDMSVGSQMFNWAGANVKYGTQPAYGYFFTRRQPYAPGITFVDHDPATVGAYHTGEVPYFLRNLDSLNLFRQTRVWTPADYQLRDTMSGLILAFARTGVPRADWPKFDAKAPRALMLGEEVKAIDWPNAKALPLLRGGQSVPPAAAPGTRARD
ncbi:carboxylesterase/lipase family protein [Novosphingobium sp.]|uniref:carboxylesterase/lipase family protein n=1 Tax=Novosphingobium sp. TaxID=1874826 RepID=UPI0035B34B23